MTTVSVIKGEKRRENVKKALKLLPESAFAGLAEAKTILIKPNLVHHRNQLASTHIDAVRAVLDVIREKTAAPVTIADASYHGTKAAFQNFGYHNLLQEYQHVELFDLNDDEAVMGWFIKRDGSKGEMGISKRVSEADFTICLAALKMHVDTGVTMTMKNWSIGIWVPEARFGPGGKYWPRWPYLHEEGPRAHNKSIAEILGQIQPNISVIDGFLAMEGDGPTRGEAVSLQVALAGVDSAAVDATACRIIGVDPTDIGYLVFSGEQNYGTIDLPKIELVGETAISAISTSLKKPDTWNDHVLAWKQE